MRLNELISSGIRPIGSFVSSTDPQTTDILAACGFDFVIIDREHGPHDNSSALGHIRAAEHRGIIPFIRVLENSQTLIQAALDLGAHGVLIPKIETAEQARRAVEASLYAPKGVRGMCSATYAANFCSPESWPEHQRNSDSNAIAIPLIETRKGVENINEIAAVDGVDYLFFGPGDLSNDMGIDLRSEPEKLKPAWDKVSHAAHSRGKRVFGVGFLGFDANADLLAGTADLLLLQSSAAQLVREARGK
ncbi:HpcH/HpaI aldolase family protein [Aquisediminimonas profunda]|uniref:HpcH/HpaI aldolase family protein n=1 Tax=Aquisediminimonas profunda TaxID=1550733 RepID=UPI001FE70736|nr:aldolase/citrate lyase family protein [Aquisediminimonas profunda]